MPTTERLVPLSFRKSPALGGLRHASLHGRVAIEPLFAGVYRLEGELSCPQIGLELAGWERIGIEKDLRLFAPLFEQKGRLSFRLDPFGDDLEPEIMRHGNQ